MIDTNREWQQALFLKELQETSIQNMDFAPILYGFPFYCTDTGLGRNCLPTLRAESALW